MPFLGQNTIKFVQFLSSIVIMLSVSMDLHYTINPNYTLYGSMMCGSAGTRGPTSMKNMSKYVKDMNINPKSMNNYEQT